MIIYNNIIKSVNKNTRKRNWWGYLKLKNILDFPPKSSGIDK